MINCTQGGTLANIIIHQHTVYKHKPNSMYNAISHHIQASIAHRTKLGGTVHSALAHWYTLYLIIPQTSKAHCNALFKVGWYSALVHNVPSQQSPVYQDYQVVHCASIAHRTRWHSAPYSTVVQWYSAHRTRWNTGPAYLTAHQVAQWYTSPV